MTGQTTVQVLQASNANLQTTAAAVQAAILAITTLNGNIPDINQFSMVYDTDNSVYALVVIVTYQEV